MAVSKELMEILACPACKGPLQDAEGDLFCPACSLRFPVREGIPVLLLDEAVKEEKNGRK